MSAKLMPSSCLYVRLLPIRCCITSEYLSDFCSSSASTVGEPADMKDYVWQLSTLEPIYSWRYPNGSIPEARRGTKRHLLEL